MSLLDDPIFYEAAGLTGVAVYILAYGLLQTGVIGGNSYLYAFLNALAAGLVIISLTLNFNLASLLIQVSFILLSFLGIARVYFLSRSIQFNDEEKFLRVSKFPTLSPIDTRQILRSGQWRNMASGEALTREGEPVEALYFVLTGQVSITLGKRQVATVDPGGFVGEIGALTKSEAGATATALTDLRVFSISSEKLAKLCDRNPEILISLSASFNQELGEKLKKTNKIIQAQN